MSHAHENSSEQRAIPLVLCTTLALSACAGKQSGDGATATGDPSTEVLDAPKITGEEPDREQKHPEPKPLVFYAHLTIDSAGRIKCELGPETGDGWVVKYEINDATGP